MDMVDTFNYLIPSDQLDDSPIIGQKLECESRNEFGTGIGLEDSLKNMLSDTDPMFGCSSTQFNLLDHEDPAFQIAGSASMSIKRGPKVSPVPLPNMEPTEFKRPVGRPKKNPLDLASGKMMLRNASSHII
uniref:Uncharacterized protein n=1 Tax=Gouania willdenowi TaxID=441366 RepID=A0A8C5HE26_GOUWI